jgi:hypothetical protein
MGWVDWCPKFPEQALFRAARRLSRFDLVVDRRLIASIGIKLPAWSEDRRAGRQLRIQHRRKQTPRRRGPLRRGRQVDG